MSSQAAFARLAAAMRKAVKRKADESDSEDSIEIVTNRGNKLRKKARFVREGKLAPPSGPEVYKRAITHAGYEREIISKRPALYDDDGFEIDSEDDDEGAQAALAAAAEFYPYSDVRIESILAPLTRPADLAEHPTLSRPFTSKPLTELTRQARETVQKEKASLWRMKHLLTLMSGDHTWAPCGILETDDDILLFSDGRDGYREHILEKDRLKMNNELTTLDGSLEEKTIAVADAALEDGIEILIPMGGIERSIPETLVLEKHMTMIDAANEAPVEEIPQIVSTETAEVTNKALPKTIGETILLATAENSETVELANMSEGTIEEEKSIVEVLPEIKADGEPEAPPNDMEVEEQTKLLEESQPNTGGDEEPPQDPEDIPEPRRMRTRAQAQAASDNTTISRPRSATPSTNSSYIHPYFLAPQSAHPVPDLGLPPVEAEETRRLLQLYIQKQEEICRGSQKIYDGLMRAERVRKTVLKWAKSDGHIGEMSDGEDWYDKEEWGLSEDLKKGQDEEEEDAATTAKKTRTRRQ